MKLMVLEVSKVQNGGLTILNQYYLRAVNDKTKEWIFVISTAQLEETDHIKVLRFPWIAQSWFHRLFFDYFVAPRISKEINPDEIISLQGTILKNVPVMQSVYIQQALYFSDIKFSFIDNPRIWIYQNILAKLRYKDMKKADQIIVQIENTKLMCIKKTNISPDKIVVDFPDCNISVKDKFSKESMEKPIFFYPAMGYEYKNHHVILNGIKRLKKEGYDGYQMVFTLNGDENKYTKKLKKIVDQDKLPVSFIGKLNKDEMQEYYTKSILLFPSKIESFGLPLLEAKAYECPIIASDMGFSHDVLQEYENVDYFNPESEDQLICFMKKFIS